MSNRTSLLLDLMGTVLEDPYRPALRAATGRAPEALDDERDPEAWPAFERGEIDEDEFARRFWRDERVLDLRAFHRARHAGYRFLPGMRELIDDVAGRARLHLVTNYPVWVHDVVARFDLAPCVETVWASCELGVRKPDPAFYERVLEGLGESPSQCLFVDDREANCAAAQEVGIPAHHFEGAEGLRRRLVAEGLLD